MKVGDLVKVSNKIHAEFGWFGLIVENIFNRGKVFKVLFFDGRIRSKGRIHMEVVK